MSGAVTSVATALHAALCDDPQHGGDRATCAALYRGLAASVVRAPSYDRAVEVVHDVLGVCPAGCASFEHLAAISASHEMRRLWALAGHRDPHARPRTFAVAT